MRSCRLMLAVLSLIPVLWAIKAEGQASTAMYPIFSKYQVLGVVYAPPGSSSSVTYANSNLVGSTQSITQATNLSNSIMTSSTIGGGLFGLGASTTNTSTDGWSTTSQNGSSVAIQTTYGNSIATLGPISASLGVNHDNDIIYILLDPVVTTTVSYTATGNTTTINSMVWNGLYSNSCDLSSTGTASTGDQPSFYQRLNGCDPNQYPYPDIVGIPVWCLKNPYYPGQGCSQWQVYTSRSWDQSYWGSSTGSAAYPTNPAGLTLQDYADILQADPFVTLNGSEINVCHPAYGPSFDPNESEAFMPTPLSAAAVSALGKNIVAQPPSTCLPGNPASGASSSRFKPYGTIEYPEPGPNGLPSTYAGSFTYSNVLQNTTTASDSHSIGSSTSTTQGFQNSFGWFGVNILSLEAQYGSGSTNAATWQNSTTLQDESINTSTASYSITGPQLSDNYTGPATYNVYLDNVYGTYAFYSPLSPQIALGTIGVSGLTPFPATAIGQVQTVELITLTNLSPYVTTMVWPAVTFTDPAFQIQPGMDGCSNQVLSPSATCQVGVQFAPVAPDTPSPVLQTNIAGVQATMIAAGTESASSFQNVLVVSETPISGTLSGSSTQGALLLASGNSVTQSNPIPNVYNYGNAVGTSAQTHSFIFTNYNSQGVTLQPLVGQLSPISLSDTTNFSVSTSPASTCVNNAIVPASGTCTFTLIFQPSQASVTSGLSAFGEVVAVNGIVGGTSVSVKLASAGAYGTGTPGIVVSPTSLTVSSGGAPAFFTVQNNSSSALASLTLNFVTVPAGNNRQFALGTSCSSSLSPGQSCTVTVSAPPALPVGASPVQYSGTYSVIGVLSGTTYTSNVSIVEDEVAASPCGVGHVQCSNFVLTPVTGLAGLTVGAGGRAEYTFIVAPVNGSYPADVSFSATGMPVGATATFSPSVIQPNEGVKTISLAIQVPGTTASSKKLIMSSVNSVYVGALLLMPFARGRRRCRPIDGGRSKAVTFWMLTAAIACLSSATGCGSRSPTSSTVNIVPTSYAILITVTCNGSSESFAVPLTVN